MYYTALPAALASATDNDYSSDDCPTYLHVVLWLLTFQIYLPLALET